MVLRHVRSVQLNMSQWKNAAKHSVLFRFSSFFTPRMLRSWRSVPGVYCLRTTDLDYWLTDRPTDQWPTTHLDEFRMAISQQRVIRYTSCLVLGYGQIYPRMAPCYHGNEIWDKMGHISSCITDISEILALSRGFSGSGYWMLSDRFYHVRPPVI